MRHIDRIDITPDTFGWQITLHDADGEWPPLTLGIADVFQFVHEVDRTLARWIADGPADFHNEQRGHQPWCASLSWFGEDTHKCDCKEAPTDGR